jgi:hypothetical protein
MKGMVNVLLISKGHKASQTLPGIETSDGVESRSLVTGHKASQTLPGIETKIGIIINFDTLPLHVTKHLKPFQGLKQIRRGDCVDVGLSLGGHKASQTLPGIETCRAIRSIKDSRCHKASQTLPGIETPLNLIGKRITSHKASQTLPGIETQSRATMRPHRYGSSQSISNPSRD